MKHRVSLMGQNVDKVNLERIDNARSPNSIRNQGNGAIGILNSAETGDSKYTDENCVLLNRTLPKSVTSTLSDLQHPKTSSKAHPQEE
jgi:hypothetical protein